MQHLFDVEIANQYGIEVAIFIKNIAYWVSFNKANDMHFHEGRYWTYNTISAFSEIFSYWSTKQVERIINKCTENGLLLKGNFNPNAHDRKCWYSLSDKSSKLLNLIISRNREMEIPKSGNGNPEIGKCISTDNKPANKTNRERKAKPSPTLLPKDFEFDEEEKSISIKNSLNIEHEFISFKVYYKQKRFSDWHGKFLLWLIRSIGYKKTNEKSIPNKPENEQRSTVMEYGPGHPTWEANRKWELKHGREISRDQPRVNDLHET